MNGILNVLKPPGMTSFDVVAHLRRVLGTRKAGHTGTLDPLAAGVLPICAGSSTKAIEYLIEKDKLYRAELTLGISTDTEDSSGNVVLTREVYSCDQQITDAVQSFKGAYVQTPPMYSALKVNGKKLCDLARQGVEVERASREVHIYSIEIVDIERCGQVRILFDVHCSKGTYIRTLCKDIGDRLGCGGHMSFLLRKKAGMFDISSSLTIEEINELARQGRLEEKLIRTETALGFLGAVEIDAVQEKKFLNGVRIAMPDMQEGYPANAGMLVRVYGRDGFIAVAKIVNNDGLLQLKQEKLFIKTQQAP